MRIKTIWPNKTKYRRDGPSHTVFANLVWAIPEHTLRLFSFWGHLRGGLAHHRLQKRGLAAFAPDWKLIISDLPPVRPLSTFPNGRRGSEHTRPAEIILRMGTGGVCHPYCMPHKRKPARVLVLPQKHVIFTA